jgi:hypothetical protein
VFFEKSNKIAELEGKLAAWEKQCARFYQLKCVDTSTYEYGNYLGIFVNFINQQEAAEKVAVEREKVEAIVRDLLEREQPWKKK